MTTINAIASSAPALSPTSPITSPISAPLTEGTVETLPNLSLEELEEKKVKSLVVFLALNGLSGERRLEEEKLLLEEVGLSKNDLSSKGKWIPLEVMKLFFNQALLNLEPHKIARMTQSSNEKWASANWLALYRKFDWLYPEVVSTLFEFQTLVKDARTYGKKTFEQIFSGFHLLKRIKEDPNALAEITIEDLQQAGIYTDTWEYPTHDQVREDAPQIFLRWFQANPACILVSLRWVSAQNFIPNLLAETANYGNLDIVKDIFHFLNKKNISPFNMETTLSNEGLEEKEEEKHLYILCALKNAIIKSHIPIADYLVSEEVSARVRWLPEDIFHQAVMINPSFESIEWLVEKKVLLSHVGSDRLNYNFYGKTAADIAVSSLILWNFFSSSAELRKNEINRVHIALYLIDKGVPFNPQYQPKDMTFLHAICHAEDVELGLRVARSIIEQDPRCIHTPTQDKNAFTPLYLAFKERKYRLMELLLEHGADATVRVQGNTVIELALQSNDLEPERILQKTGNLGLVSQYNLHSVYPEWVSTPQEYAQLTKEAVQYGQRDFRQIFEGLNILRIIKLAGSHAPITFGHLQRAGIVQKGPLYPDDVEANEQAQNAFVDWARDHPAHLLAFLRWVPVQRDIPHLCKQDLTSPAHAKKAFKQAIKNADLPLAHYLLDRADIHPLPINSLHIAAGTGSLEMVKLLINHNMLLGKKGIGQDNQNSYRDKTAAEVAVSAIAASYFSSNAPQAIRDHGMHLVSTACYLLQEGQKQDISFAPSCTPTGTTLLHAACYSASEKEERWLAQFAFDQDSTCINAVDSEGRTPLYRAIQQKRSLLIDFLLNNGAQVNLSRWDSAVLRLSHPEILDQLQGKKKTVSMHSTDASVSPTRNLTRMLSRLGTLLAYLPWPQWGSLRRLYALYLSFFQRYLAYVQRQVLTEQGEDSNLQRLIRTVNRVPSASIRAFQTTNTQSIRNPVNDALTTDTPTHRRYWEASLNTIGSTTLIPNLKTYLQSYSSFIGNAYLANDSKPSSSMHSLDENTLPE